VEGAGEGAGAWMKDQTGRMVGRGSDDGGGVEAVER